MEETDEKSLLIKNTNKKKKMYEENMSTNPKNDNIKIFKKTEYEDLNNNTIKYNITNDEKVIQQKKEKNILKKKKGKKKNRCCKEGCNKKLLITAYACRCGMKFCSLHTPATEHNCAFDYKLHQERILEKQNPTIKTNRGDFL